ncbi:hypothetical protein EV1_036120 [Malus domestica]|uniref:GBF-interacting protein 1 N-terminal domain-containing protein n=1 Tax=Malus domestica TaxID=3750 RepID=A0A498JZV2_MALDO|nr:uncharacterized protein LOC103427870 isoform X3 [Malus domestica]RXH99012.1 hypothetical protein DVH24_011337 [Malus domestica]
MSGRGGGGVASNGKGNTGISGIPAGSRKMVQSLKEIVNNCTEQEIYAMLKDCNMDPNEAVNRLLAQDPFHEVKSKREKKKESKEPTDSRSRGASNASSYGARGGDRYSARGGSNHFSSNDSGFSHGKSAYKKENGTHAYPGSASGMAGNHTGRRPTSYSDSVGSENKMPTLSTDDGISSFSQPSSGYQSAWGGVPGQVSMADIVKMGRPQAKATTMPNPHNHSGNHHDGVPPAASLHHNLHSPQDHVPKLSATHDEWPLIDPPSVSMSSVLGAPANSELYADSSNVPVDRANQHIRSQIDEVEVEEDDSVEALPSQNEPTSVSGRHLQEDNSGGASNFDNSLYEDINSYQPQRHAFEENEAEEDVSSVAANLQQLNLQNDDRGAAPEEEKPPVVIPNHLQLHTPDVLNLSFGSFRSGPDPALPSSDSFASEPQKRNFEETSGAVDVSAIAHSDARNPEYYGDEHLMNASDESLVHRTVASAGDYESPSVSQAEILKQETHEPDQGNQYVFSSAPGFAYENSQQLDAAFSHQHTSSQMQNMAPFSNVMAYTNSLPSTLLASSAQAAREDFPYSPFPMTQSMPTKYGNAASSISGPTISMAEALRAGGISAPQPTPQGLPGANVATGPALPQHLAVHPYSQPTLPLGHFSNMIGYPFLPQSYTYMPSAFQQQFAGNSTYHQSLAAVLPQYKNSVSVSSLPQSANIPPGYGFSSSTSIPGGNFPLNPPSAPTGTTMGYDDVVNSQYKDNSHLISLQQQQNDNSGMWVHGPGSRAMSAVPASNYYSFQGQNQQHAGFRQAQQPPPSQQYAGTLGYPNFYHSQTGMSLEHQQQQSSRDASLGSSQGGQPSKQSQQQLWQNSY